MAAWMRNPIATAREAAARATRLGKLELELRMLELRRLATDVGYGAALGLVAVLLTPLLALALLAAAAAGLATVVPVWLAILIVSGILLVAVLAVGFASFVFIRRAFGRRGGRG